MAISLLLFSEFITKFASPKDIDRWKAIYELMDEESSLEMSFRKVVLELKKKGIKTTGKQVSIDEELILLVDQCVFIDEWDEEIEERISSSNLKRLGLSCSREEWEGIINEIRTNLETDLPKPCPAARTDESTLQKTKRKNVVSRETVGDKEAVVLQNQIRVLQRRIESLENELLLICQKHQLAAKVIELNREIGLFVKDLKEAAGREAVLSAALKKEESRSLSFRNVIKTQNDLLRNLKGLILESEEVSKGMSSNETTIGLRRIIQESLALLRQSSGSTSSGTGNLNLNLASALPTSSKANGFKFVYTKQFATQLAGLSRKEFEEIKFALEQFSRVENRQWFNTRVLEEEIPGISNSAGCNISEAGKESRTSFIWRRNDSRRKIFFLGLS